MKRLTKCSVDGKGHTLRCIIKCMCAIIKFKKETHQVLAVVFSWERKKMKSKIYGNFRIFSVYFYCVSTLYDFICVLLVYLKYIYNIRNTLSMYLLAIYVYLSLSLKSTQKSVWFYRGSNIPDIITVKILLTRPD